MIASIYFQPNMLNNLEMLASLLLPTEKFLSFVHRICKSNIVLTAIQPFSVMQRTFMTKDLNIT